MPGCRSICRDSPILLAKSGVSGTRRAVEIKKCCGQEDLRKTPLYYKNRLNPPPWTVSTDISPIFSHFPNTHIKTNLFRRRFCPHIKATRAALSTIIPLQANLKCATTRTPHFLAAARLKRTL
ncbi:unnamed protein product [Tuber aestivum]|uniref:Uncharacterized protein n=1 Tax=Tuber aestivum TaxID=59557 RepID=A0A292PVW7_9PEZI|nr:unnamed protein product [Tuber aestivum]